MSVLLGHRTPPRPDAAETATFGMMVGGFNIPSVRALVNSAEMKMVGVG
jgi:hypothetical protein